MMAEDTDQDDVDNGVAHEVKTKRPPLYKV